MNFISYNIYVRSKEDFLRWSVIMTDELLKEAIEQVDKLIEKNDSYFSRTMATYSKVYKELEDLKQLIQMAGEQNDK